VLLERSLIIARSCTNTRLAVRQRISRDCYNYRIRLRALTNSVAACRNLSSYTKGLRRFRRVLTFRKEMSNEKQRLCPRMERSKLSQELSDVERNRVPPNPAGLTELSDAELSDVAGGAVGSIHTGRPCLPPTAYHCTFYCPAIL